MNEVTGIMQKLKNVDELSSDNLIQYRWELVLREHPTTKCPQIFAEQLKHKASVRTDSPVLMLKMVQ